MDLAALLADGTDGIGHPVLAGYYAELFRRLLPASSYEGSFRVRAALNFGVQQLATRSRISPETEMYLQVGGIDAFDLPAALIEAMPHTRVACLAPPFGTGDALAAMRACLPTDAMPDDICLNPAVLPKAGFGLIAVFADADDFTDLRPLLGATGRILRIGRSTHGALPTINFDA